MRAKVDLSESDPYGPVGHRGRAVSFVSACVTLMLAACGNDASPTSPPPAEPAVVSVFVEAPAEIAPGESVQLVAKARMSDGSTKDVSNQATWTPQETKVLAVTAAGRATGLSSGEVTVRAQYISAAGSALLMVIPKGTYRLTGTVREAGFGIGNVSITVQSGVGQGLQARTWVDGSYVLYGVAGNVQLRLERDAYRTNVLQLDVTAHSTRDLEIVADRPRSDYRGVYTLAVTGSSCTRVSKGTLPQEANRRVYTATVEQDGPRLSVTLSDADFIVSNGHGNGFTGFVEATGAILVLISETNWDIFYGYFLGGAFDMAERVEGSAVLISGTARVNATPSGLSGPLEGTIAVGRVNGPPFEPFSAVCHGNHQFEMVRR